MTTTEARVALLDKWRSPTRDIQANDLSTMIGHIGLYIDDDESVTGMRVIADDWYDASTSTETPAEFVERLRAEAEAAATD